MALVICQPVGDYKSRLSNEKLSHHEVLEVGKKAAADFARLLSQAFS
jgi:hypothetical protein